jgi:5-methylcytosine-specific restriction endonuclease McrA
MAVLARYGRKCMLCDVVDTEIHVDHIKPRSLYPFLSLTFSNLQVLCRDCNMKKSNYHSEDYREDAISRKLDAEAVYNARMAGI